MGAMTKELIREDTDRDCIAGLKKGLAVIECFDDEHERLTSAEVAGMIGLSRAAARRCLITLHKLGYADFDGKLFSLTPRILRLGYSYLLSTPLSQLVQPFLEHLNERVKECCSVSILDGDEIVYIAYVSTKRLTSTGVGVGTRFPAYCTSMGRVLLAALDPGEAAHRLATAERQRVTPYTRVTVDDLTSVLDEVRSVGYCVADQERAIGVVTISVPLLSASGRTVASVNIATLAGRVPASAIAASYLPDLLEMQKNLRPLIKP